MSDRTCEVKVRGGVGVEDVVQRSVFGCDDDLYVAYLIFIPGE